MCEYITSITSVLCVFETASSFGMQSPSSLNRYYHSSNFPELNISLTPLSLIEWASTETTLDK